MAQKRHSRLYRLIMDPIVAVLVGIVWVVFKMLPVQAASAAGSFCGRYLAYPLMRRRNKIALRNMEIAFPQKTPEWRRENLKNMWRHWGRFFAEMPHSKEWVERAEVTGKSYLEQAKADGVGGFVCSAHLGNWEVASSYVSQNYFLLHPVYRPANNKWLEKLMFKRRKGVLIPKNNGGARIMVDLLRKGEHIAILCDQRLREGVAVPLFGKMAMTPVAMITLAIKLKVPILMGKAIREKDGHYRMVVEPLALSKAENPEIAIYETAERMNQRLEEWIRETPEQWMWIHRRFDKSEYK